jgi:Domain of unknown function (DUF4440)
MSMRYTKHLPLLSLVVAISTISSYAAEPAPDAKSSTKPGEKLTAATEPSELFRRVESMDRAMFEAFNKCDLKKLESFLVPKLEFYHDQAGVTWSRAQFLADVTKNVCGKFKRELVAGTMEVWPLGSYGAVYSGSHVFCQTGATRCEGIGKFMNIWENKAGTWKITRIVSYDHRTNPQ